MCLHCWEASEQCRERIGDRGFFATQEACSSYHRCSDAFHRLARHRYTFVHFDFVSQVMWRKRVAPKFATSCLSLPGKENLLKERRHLCVFSFNSEAWLIRRERKTVYGTPPRFSLVKHVRFNVASTKS